MKELGIFLNTSKIFVILCLLSLFSCNQNSNVIVNEKNSDTINTATLNQNELKLLAEALRLKYTVIDNRPDEKCDQAQADGNCFSAEISLSLPFDSNNRNWQIYFSNMSPVQKDFSPEFSISHVQGDLHKIEPSNQFKGFRKEKVYRIPFKAGFWHISEFDSPPNFFIRSGDLKPLLIESTKALIDSDTGLEKMQHVESFTNKEKQFKRTDKDQSEWVTSGGLYAKLPGVELEKKNVLTRIIPKPRTIKVKSNASLSLANGLKIIPNSFNINRSNPALIRLEKFGVAISRKGGVPVEIVKVEGRGREGYQLKISEQKISIEASTTNGAFYALQSLAGLITIGNSEVTQLTIIDSPRFKFRGFHLDVARNFRNKNFVIKLLDQMAAYKLNKFHFHLGDDEGWRLEIPGLPELTKIGAVRCLDLNEDECLLPQLGAGVDKGNPNNGFYSLSEYQEILQAAAARHIEVIPSFDMPGHSRAAVKSMQARYRKYMRNGQKEQAEEYLLSDPDDASNYSSVQFYSDNTLNVCMSSTYHFIEKVIDEVSAMHRQANVPLTTYHIGADETPGAWKDSPECKKLIQEQSLAIGELGNYFIQRVSRLLAKRQIEVAGWSDGMSRLNPQTMPDKVQVNAWTPLFWNGHQVAHRLANQNWDVIVSIPDATYFDFPYAADPKERGYYWGSRYTDTEQVFQLMPENLPLHAEFWTDRENRPMILDDRPGKNEKGELLHSPMRQGVRFKGLQGHLWSEMVRSDKIAEYMIFPRLLALAERAWHKAPWEPDYLHQGAIYSAKTGYFTKEQRQQRDKDWLAFSTALATKELPKLDQFGVFYRLPLVGAVVEGESLKVNVPLPGISIEFQRDDGEWQVIEQAKNYVRLPLSIELPGDGKIKVRTSSSNGSRKGRYITVN
ncbi:family 20 glycosylhydrolase [Aliikangiella sp. G2MR2-5]|uniref:family 20 glycosylhydrolase n=1 Tax=Aliikangiella sp. G2MR2-5 TaxID=2788943 RepID=UPI0018AB0BA0|nr:family 20 glycosylhydrolase [Aliikangiella sp. G2MR2-5]